MEIMGGLKKLAKHPIYVSIYIAVKGFLYAVKRERSIRYHILFAALAVFLGYWLGIDRLEWLFVVTSIFMVLVAEIVNTAIEKSIDLFVKGYSKKAAIAKDISAGAVCAAAINALVIGAIIFLPRIF